MGRRPPDRSPITIRGRGRCPLPRPLPTAWGGVPARCRDPAPLLTPPLTPPHLMGRGMHCIVRYRPVRFRYHNSEPTTPISGMRHLTRSMERQQKRLRARELRACPTPSESQAWQLLRRRQIGGLRFRRQHVLGRFILDFYCPAYRLTLEIDGGIHEDPGHQAYDQARDLVLAELGIEVVRIRNEDVSAARLTAILAPYSKNKARKRGHRSPSP